MPAPEPRRSTAVEVFASAALAGVAHGFLGRRGGVSQGALAGLNCGPGSIGPDGDSAAAVAENRRRAVAAVLPGARLVTVWQVHSPDCIAVSTPWEESDRPHADALVCATPGLLLGILTADCAPVLLADAQAGVVGAAHAGWKGARAGVIENTVAAMVAHGARRGAIAAAIGPTIAQPSYEVDAALRDRFAADDGAFFRPGRPGHWQFDLPGYVAARLAAARVETIDRLALDTYAAPERFFSFRRATHRGEPAYGRQLALIGLPQPGRR
ncbi:MAG: peptidoglycan editing factor PgeF [Sphingomonadales bacterium]|nr:peptidoglycan editing factor PgeF [Sphingomonadales bacterium]